jgi:hypothetical protein
LLLNLNFQEGAIDYPAGGPTTNQLDIMIKLLDKQVVYRDPRYYSTFPGVAALGNGRLVVAFRRSPNYQGLPGIPDNYFPHGDPNSQFLCVASDDNGQTWSQPQLIWASPTGASQDAGLFYDGQYLFANSFLWDYVPNQVAEAMKASGTDEYLHTYLTHLIPAGSYVMRSGDGGRSWEGPFMPDPLPGDKEVLPGRPLRLHNRANICRASDGRLLLCGQILEFRPEFHSAVGLYQSTDAGASWQYLTTPAADQGTAVFEEPFLYITDAGNWVVLMRCHRSPQGQRFKRAHLWITRSADQGKTWSAPRDAGFHAEPSAACRLADGRVLLVYGYRLEPFGLRARVCDPELRNVSEAPEQIIRDDCGRIDTGYPNIAPLGDNRYLIVHYVNHPSYNGASAIEGVIVTC